jgi:signal transduction histidine kinase
MEQHGGSITVNSMPGEFCEFTLDLPATEPRPETA